MSQRSQIKLRRDLGGAKNLLKWRIVRGGKASLDDLRDPAGANPSIAVCMYDASGSPQPRVASALPGGTCASEPCWKRLAGGRGYRYRNRAATPDGLTHLKLRLTRSGGVQLLAKGRGGNLPLPPLGLLLPVRMQLLIGDVAGTTCWGSSFGRAVRNDGTIFKANGS